MAITIYTLDKPYLWAEAVSGGSLPASTTFYFTGFFYYCVTLYSGACTGKAADQISVTTTSANKTIKMEVYQKGGNIVSYSDAGSGYVTVTTSSPHNLSNGDSVWLRATTNYYGKYTISSVSTYTFNIYASWAGDDGASKWFSVPGFPTKPSAFTDGNIYLALKWDYYSMINPATGKFFRWMNTNDPTVSNEWSYGWGHKRWNCGFHGSGTTSSFLSTGTTGEKYWNISEVVLTSARQGGDQNKIFEATGGDYEWLGGRLQPEIAMRNYYDAAGTNVCYKLPEGLPDDESGVLILIDDSDSNNSWYHFVYALINSGVLGKSVIITKEYPFTGIATTFSYFNGNVVIIRGLIYGKRTTFPSSKQPIWRNKNITMLGGNITHSGGSYGLKLMNCNLNIISLNGSQWNQPYLIMEDCRWQSNGTGQPLIDYINFSGKNDILYPALGSAIAGSYVSCSNINITGMSGDYVNYTSYANVLRYFANGMYLSDCKFKRCSCIPTYTSPFTPKVVNYTNIEFSGIQSDASTSTLAHNFDFGYEASYVTGNPNVNWIFNCYNVTSNERSNKRVRVHYEMWGTSGASKFGSGSVIEHRFFFPIDIKVIDKDGNPLSGVSVTIMNNNPSGSDIYTATTDSNGNITTQQVKAYVVAYDPNNSDGYWYQDSSRKFYSKTIIMDNISIIVEKTGFATLYLKNITLDEPKKLIFKLYDSGESKTILYNSNIYNSVIY